MDRQTDTGGGNNIRRHYLHTPLGDSILQNCTRLEKNITHSDTQLQGHALKVLVLFIETNTIKTYMKYQIPSNKKKPTGRIHGYLKKIP